MKIKVLGTGCPTCQKLYMEVSDVIKELGLYAELEKVEDLQKIMAYGVMRLPALVINEEVKFSGRLPNKEELKKYFQ